MLALIFYGCQGSGGDENSGAVPLGPDDPQIEAAIGGDPMQQAVYNYILGHLSIKENDQEAAERAFSQVARFEPNLVEVRLILTHFALQRGDLKGAEEHSRAVLAQQAEHFGARLLLAGILAATQREPEAISHYETLLVTSPENAQVRLFLARLKGKVEGVAKVKKILQPLLKDQDLAWRVHLTLGRVHLDRKELSDAVSAFEESRKLAPDQLEPVLLLGSAYQSMGKPDKSEKVYRSFLTADPDNLVIHNRLGRLLLDQKDTKEAVEEFRTISRLAPDRIEERLTAALILLSERQAWEALNELRLAEAIQPDNPGVLYYLGQSLEMLERKDEARSQYAKLGEETPFYREAQVRLALLESEAGQNSAAVSRMQNLMTRFPKRPDLHLSMTFLLLEEKAFDEVVRVAGEGLALNSEMPRLYFNRAVALDKLGRWPEAEADLKTVIAKEPDNATALNYLGYTWADRNEKLQESLELLTRAAQLSPGDGFIADSLGWVLFRLNRLEESLKIVREAVRVEPNDPTINEHLGDILHAMGHKEEAISVWKRALELDPSNVKLKEKLDKTPH